MDTKARGRVLLSVPLLLPLLVGLTGCKRNTNQPAAEKPVAQQPVLPTAPTSSPELGSASNQVAGIGWTVPPGWETEPAHQMRVATYRIHAIAGDPQDAECAVYFFGSGQGGTVEANLERWAQQFTAPDGQARSSPAKIEKRVISGMDVSTLTVSGTYLGAGMMSQAEEKKPHFRMMAAIVQAPEGLVFFKLIGPLNTVASAEGDFNSLLQSLHKA